MSNKIIKIMAFGDSNTYGPGVDPYNSYPSQLERKLISNGYNCVVFNKGINGNTAKDGLDRIKEDFEECQPHIVIVHFGVADLKNGFSVNEIRDNFYKILEICKNYGARIILFGHKLPESAHHREELYNLAKVNNIEVGNDFFNMYSELAELYQIDFLPSLLEDILGEQGTIFYDGHLTEIGYQIFVDRIFPLVINNINIITDKTASKM